jgi:hypothetical protein
MGDETTGGSDATGVDCEELTSFGDYAPALAAVQSNPAASPDEIQEVMKALSELASGAPDDVRQDFETMSETMQEMARAVSDLGLEPGDIPDEGQTDQLLGLAADLLDDTKYLDAATSVAAWFDAAVAQCSSTDTETTESGITTFGDETTTETSAVGGEGVDETCEDLLAFAVLAKDRGMSSETASVDDVEDVAAAVSELASRASAEPEEAGFLLAGEPRDSLEGLAEALESYLGVLSELGLEPGPDALVEPRVADAAERVRDNDSSLFDWFGARCSEDDKSELEEITG